MPPIVPRGGDEIAVPAVPISVLPRSSGSSRPLPDRNRIVRTAATEML